MMHKPKIHIGYDFILLICVLYLFDRENLLWLTLGAAGVHEIGHLIMASFCRVSVSQFRLSAFGACMVLENAASIPYRKEFLLALGGPLIGFVVGLLSAMLHWWVFAGLNVVLSLFNLLPIAPLDGGKMLRAVLGSVFSITTVDRLLSVLSVLIAVAIMVGCLLLSASAQCTIGMILFSAFLAGTLFQGFC